MDSKQDVSGTETQSKPLSAGPSLAKRFQTRAIEMAREGVLGSLKTRKSLLIQVYTLLASQLDNSAAPILVFGEKGSGKRRLVDEFLYLSNFYHRLSGGEMGSLRVYFPDFLKKGFTQNFLSPQIKSHDFLIIEDIERLSLELQEELVAYLTMRAELSNAGVACPRILLLTTRALSIRVIAGEFRRDLFALISGAACFIPSLNERPEDQIHLVYEIITELKGKASKFDVPAWFIDNIVGTELWGGNIDELKAVIKFMFIKEADPSKWKPQHLPLRFQIKNNQSSFKIHQTTDITEDFEERKHTLSEIMKAGGNRKTAAQNLGITEGELLRRMIRHALR